MQKDGGENISDLGGREEDSLIDARFKRLLMDVFKIPFFFKKRKTP